MSKEKSPELAELYAEISLKDKPELSALMYQREHLDTQLNRLRAALARYQEHQPIVQAQIFGLSLASAGVMLKPVLSGLQRELQRQDRRLNPEHTGCNAFKQAGEWVKTRLKNWVIKKGSVKSASEQDSTDTNTERSSAWTCVSNCNPSHSKGSVNYTTQKIDQFLEQHQPKLTRLKMALGWRGIDEKTFENHHFYSLMNGGSVKLLGDYYISFDGNEVQIDHKR